MLGRLIRFNEALERVLAYLAGACLALFTVVVCVDVIYRQVLAQPLMWPSEWSVMAFVWSVMLGGSVAARRRAHFVVEMLPRLPRALDLALHLFVTVLTLVLAFILLRYGYGMAMAGLRRFTPMMGYPMVWVFAAFPFAGAAFAVFALEHLLRLLKGELPGEQEGPAHP